MGFYQDQIVLSVSYGLANSKVLLFDNCLADKSFDFDEKNAKRVISLPPFLEEISGEGSSLYLLFESGQARYRLIPTIFHGDRVIKINLDKDI
ncbi:hypothetical protein [Streptococcus saliviloxodontae]|uniref:Uncharacterized protein n=1 Tax=Streptococcus saliviloxodontae TaxID=1349416 RepID=A0ABS2PIL3_9STRE|nr:hypothetical protein [Streptococcus saliviloxodontae]MBM7635269.1 hypothetical protein [Streptococcus saliviloxodontae]